MFHVEHPTMSLEKELLTSSKPYLQCKDYLVSKEQFDLLYNQAYGVLITNPVPDKLSLYYESEDYISHSNNSKGAVAFLYNWVRSHSMRKKEKMIKALAGQKTLLDVGCGVGTFLEYCRTKNWEVTGTEPSAQARSIAAQNGAEIKENLSQIQKASFSIITMWHVLEHVPNLTETINQLDELLAKDGRLVVAVPNFESWDAKHYREFWAAYDVPRHLWHFSKKGIEKIFGHFDFEIEQIHPMKFDSYYVSLLSEKHKTKSSNFLRAFFNGWKSNRRARKQNNYSSLIYVLKKAPNKP